MPNNYVSSTRVRCCFVCGDEIASSELTFNKKVNLPVCSKCKGQKEELIKEREHLDCMGEGFTVGCIS